VSIELVFERKIGCQTGISKLKTHILFHIGLCSWVEETHVSLERKPLTLEGGEFTTLFPCENRVSFERSNACPTRFSMGIIAQFVPNRPIHLSWRNTCIWKEIIYVRRWSM
jgi:hypothetical protein